MMNEVNVEQIMEELKKKAAARKIEQEAISFDKMAPLSSYEELQYVEPYDREEFLFQLTEVNKYFWINPEIKIENKNFFKRKIKQIIQKLIKFAVYPLVDKQNEFNRVATCAFNQIRNYLMTHDNIDKRIEELQFVMEKEIVKPMKLYSESFKVMADKYEALLLQIEEYEKKEKDSSLTIELLQKKIELLDKELQIVKSKER